MTDYFEMAEFIASGNLKICDTCGHIEVINRENFGFGCDRCSSYCKEEKPCHDLISEDTPGFNDSHR